MCFCVLNPVSNPRPCDLQHSNLINYATACPSKLKIITPWPESASELYRSSDRSLSAKLLPTITDGG
jgi:hypothetical protein